MTDRTLFAGISLRVPAISFFTPPPIALVYCIPRGPMYEISKGGTRYQLPLAGNQEAGPFIPKDRGQ